MSAARISGAVLGYRAFEADAGAGLLLGAVSGAPWPRGVARADCELGHPAPASGCECGLYAYHSHPEEQVELSLCEWPELVAAVLLWGMVEVHADGVRAEFARVAVLERPASRRADHAGVRALARAYGATTCAFGELAAVGREFGTPVPDALRPGGGS